MKRSTLVLLFFIAIAISACNGEGKLFDFSGQVFEDSNRDGIMDPDEPRIQGVTIKLIDESDPSKAILTTETDPDGSYAIAYVSDSKSFIIEVEAEGRTFTQPFQGGNEDLQSHVNLNGRSNSQTAPDVLINAGLLPLEVAQAPEATVTEQPTATQTLLPPTLTPTNTQLPPPELVDESIWVEYRSYNRLGAPVIYVDDALNDPQNCFVGDPIPENLPPQIDLVAGKVYFLGRDPAWIQVEFQYAGIVTDTTAGSFLGMGFEVDDPGNPNVTGSPWVFDALGDLSFNAQQFGGPGTLEPAFARVENGTWNLYQAAHTINVTATQVLFDVPMEFLYGTETPLLTSTNGEACDSLEIDTEAWTQFINDLPQEVPAPEPEPVQIIGNWSEPDNETYMNGGSFAGSTSGPRNRISFTYNLNGAVPCENLVMVSVFHIRPDDNPDQILQKPSDGYVEGLGGGLLPYVPPEDADAVNGFVVDAPPRLIDPAASGFLPNTNPAMPSFEINGNVLTAVDEPQFLKEGYTAYFETAVVCLDGDQIKVLGSTRWVHRSGMSRIIPNPRGGVDWGPASESFTAALRGWLANHQGN